jgi:oligopeptidase B
MKGANRFSFELESIEQQELEELNGDTTDENDRAYIKGARARNGGDGLISSSGCHPRGYVYTNKVKTVTIVGVLLGTIIYYSHLFFENNEVPPLARRDEGRVNYAGTPPPGWDRKIPRQSADSEHSLINPPIAVEDPYGWMRDETRSDPEVLQHLEDNNHYTRARTRHLKKIEETLYNEMKSFILETFHTFPNLKGDYYYYRRTIKGMPYPLHVRAPKSFSSSVNDGDNINRNNNQFHAKYLEKHLSLWDGSKSMPILPNEIVYLNENIMAQGYDYFDVGSIEISPSQELMAYTVDTHGNEFYQLFIQRIDSGNIIFPNNGHQKDNSRSPFIISGQILWGATDDNIFYTKTDEAERSYQVFCRTFDFSENNVKIGDAIVSEETFLFEELDSLYYVGIDKTSDGKYLLIYNDSSESSEVHYVNLSDSSIVSKSPSIILNRAQGVLYSVDHLRGSWLILSNRGRGPNLRLFKANVEGDTEWKRLMDPDNDHPLLDGIPMEDLLVFENHIIIKCRKQGLNELWIVAIDADFNVIRVEELKWDTEPAHSVDLGLNENFDASSIIVKYESLVSIFSFVVL